MQSKHKKRICIVTRSLSEGGADRVASMQSIFLHNLGYQIFIVTILDATAYPYKGTLLNLGELKAKDNSLTGRFKRFLRFKKFIDDNHIDVIIDHRVRNKTWSEYLISKWIYRERTIYIVHNIDTQKYFPKVNWIAKRLYKWPAQIVAVSSGIALKINEVYGYTNVTTILNAVDFNYIDSSKNETIKVPDNYVLWYGRFENEQKNIPLLLRAFIKSPLPEKDIKLIVMGHGKDQKEIEDEIEALNAIDDIIVLPFTANPFPYIHKSKFVVLSSNYEGFPMTIIESLATEKPVVTVQYKNSEELVVKHKFNGLVVKNHDESALANALNCFIEDRNLYLSCSANARRSIAHLNTDQIGLEWQTLIENK